MKFALIPLALSAVLLASGTVATASPVAAQTKGPAPSVRVVDHPQVRPFKTTSPNSAWLIQARLDVIWDPATTPGCQATMRIVRSRDGGDTWVKHTEWHSLRESDGSFVFRVTTVALPGLYDYMPQWSLDCPPIPGSGQKPYRRTLANGISNKINTPRAKGPGGYGKYEHREWGATGSWSGGYGGGGDWGTNGQGGLGDWGGGFGGGGRW